MADNEVDYGGLVKAQNRKKKRAGGWQNLGLDETVFKGIVKKGYHQPTPIQRKAIPLIVDGRDVVAMSRTGSGKTAAFVIPMLQKLKRREVTGVRALLISPTRELAMQTFKFVKELGRFTGLRAAVLVGGDRIEDQFAVIHEKPDILIATPGRLLHLVVEMNLKLTTVEYFVLDEADRLFEMGFADQLKEVLKRLPDNRQTLLFSATLPKLLVDFAKAGLTDPVLVRLDLDEKISEHLSMIFLTCRSCDKVAVLLHLLRTLIPPKEQTIVFCATMKHVEYLSTVISRAGLDCAFLYSQLDTAARKQNIERFRNKGCPVLIVTDVAARGVDIPLLDNAINFHFPPKAKLFVHRVGRVARAGRSGRSFSLVAPDEIPYLADLFLFLGRPLEFAKMDSEYRSDMPLVGSFPDDLVDLQMDFLKSIHMESDVNELLTKSENALNKYIRTRPQPSAESVRRTKDVLKRASVDASIHPIVRSTAPPCEKARTSLLAELRNFKPNTTIFEFQSGNKALPAAVMKNKRRDHQKYIKDHTVQSVANNEASSSEKAAEADDEDLASTFHETVKRTKFALSEGLRKNRRRKADELREEKATHYITYAPADADSERALAVDRSFDAAAKAHTIEISADDDVGLYKQAKRKKWDRKLKKFIGESGEERGKRLIRTEEGTLLPASFKSGRYEEWQRKQKLAYREEGSDEEAEGRVGTETKPARVVETGKFNINRGLKRGRLTKGVVKDGVKSELKSKDQILKARKRKLKIQAYQKHRREENLKKRKGLLGKRRKFGGINGK